MEKTLVRNYYSMVSHDETLNQAMDRGIIFPDFPGNKMLCDKRESVDAYIRKWDPLGKVVQVKIEMTILEGENLFRNPENNVGHNAKPRI